MKLAVKTRDVLCEADRLELDALVAPVLRSASEKTLARRVAVTDADGNVIRYATGREVLKGLAKVQELEHVVEDGKRPKAVVCSRCGADVATKKTGKLPTTCRKPCGSPTVCGHTDCHERAPTFALSVSEVRRRKGKPWLCREHGKARRAKAARASHKRKWARTRAALAAQRAA